MKRTISAVLLFTAALILLIGCGQSGATFADGSFTGSGRGHHGDIKVEVTIESGSIASIDVLENPENKVLSAPVYEKLSKAMIDSNSADVDAVSGASDSSRGFTEAVADALKKSNPDAVQEGSSDKQTAKLLSEEELEQSYDVVIIGAGGAGLTAAVSAAAEGASVAVLEKMPAPGGNTLISGGGLNVPGSWMQEKHGITDSVETYVADTLKGGDNEGEAELVQVMAENALETAEWLRDDIGMVFLDRVQQFGGHSVPRALIPEGNSGEQMTLKLMDKGKTLGVDLKTSTEAHSLIQDDAGMITGVLATNSAGQEISFLAEKAVIVAAGGFGSNVEMRMSYNPEYDEKYMSTCLPGITGDGIAMATAADAGTTDMSFIQTYPTCNPVTGIISYVANSRFYGAILVNKEGKRFINEMGRRDKVSKEILAQSGKTAYLLWDDAVESKSKMIEMHPEEYKSLVEEKLICKADSLTEAAEYFGIDASELEKSLARYNSFKGSADADFGRGGSLVSFEKAPFYIQKVVPSVHHTMGGLKINTDAQVLDADGNPIPRLYAAGEVAGGIHGTNRLGGNAITDCVVFGRIAGSNAAK